MLTRLFALVSGVLYLGAGISAEDEIKRSTYPFMAFLYYQDESVLGLSGDRFLQGAVLVRPSFLISSSPESTISQEPLSKTLLARLGATVIDSKFTLNEDEDEQEQEVIQITRPFEHDSSKWWVTDICLLKTLLPITATNSVRFTQLSTKQEPIDKVCHILLFKKKTGTDVRLLTRLFVEMMPPSKDNCGDQFVPKIMTCASDQPSSDFTQLSGDYCRGNSGGPLICDDDVIALQTYLDGDCKPPHLYQLLSSRKRFLDCSIDEKCDNKEHCNNVCTVIQKDVSLTPTRATSEITPMIIRSSTPEATTQTSAPETTEPVTETTKTTVATEPPETEPSTMSTTPSTTTTQVTTVTSTKSWPNEKEGRKKNDDDADALNRPTNVEAQRTGGEVRVRSRATSNKNLIVFQSLLYNTFLLSIYLS